MAKLNHLKKKAAVAEHSATYKTDPDAVIAALQAAEFSPEHITEIIDAIEGELPVKPKEKTKAPEKVGLNPVFEKWTIRVEFERDPDTNEPLKDKWGANIPIFKKVELLRECKISDEQAAILNAQSVNSLIHYYKK